MNAIEDDECVYHLLLPTQAVMDTAGAQDTQKKDGERSIVVGVDSSFEGTPNKEGLIVTGIYTCTVCDVLLLLGNLFASLSH